MNVLKKQTNKNKIKKHIVVNELKFCDLNEECCINKELFFCSCFDGIHVK